MVVLLHVATGAAAGALLGSRRAALAVGPLLHALGDRMPHEDIPSRPFEALSGLAGLVLVAATRGPLHPATLGAVAAAVPDAEHVLPLRRELFPSHRLAGWHRTGGASAPAQLAAALVLLALVVRRG